MTGPDVLLTGAAGKTGRALLRALGPTGASVRALVHREEQAGAVLALGAAEAVVGDLRSPGLLREAAADVDAVYHVGPNVHPGELTMGLIAVQAARDAGVERFVLHSVLHPQVEAMPHHWRKLRVEEALVGSGLAFTILRPAAYLQNLLAHRAAIVEEGRLPIPYVPETRIALVDLEEVAAVAAAVLTGEGHAGAAYDLVGVPYPSQRDVARALSAALERPVTPEVVDRDAWRSEALADGMERERVETLVRMFAWYERHGFRGNDRVLRVLLGRAPVGVEAFARRELAESG